MDWYLGVLKKYAVFEGRARRKEYWMFVLFNVIVSVILGIVESVVGNSGYPFGHLRLGGPPSRDRCFHPQAARY
jgi:uncharacterized membrane protein YhaH (DUF805 family)